MPHMGHLTGHEDEPHAANGPNGPRNGRLRSQRGVPVAHLERATGALQVADHDAAERVVRLGVGGQPGVALLDQLGRIGVHRPQAFEHMLVSSWLRMASFHAHSLASAVERLARAPIANSRLAVVSRLASSAAMPSSSIWLAAASALTSAQRMSLSMSSPFRLTVPSSRPHTFAANSASAGRRHVVVRGGAHAAQRVAERGGLGLVRKQLERGLDEPLGRQFGVAGHIPQRQPDHGTGERVVETVQVLDRELQRGGVEAQLGVGQVVVVDQNERRARLAGGLGHHGGLAVHVEFDAVGAHDAAGGRILVVQADGQAVRTQHRMLGRRALGQGQGGDGAVRVLLDVRGDGVDAGACSSHRALHAFMSRPEVASSSLSRSSSVALANAWRVR